MFQQILDPTGNLFITWLVALVPVVALLFMLAVLRLSAWIATLIGSIITFALGYYVWQMPLDQGELAYLYGSATGVWNVDWITFWGVMLFNTLVMTGAFDKLRRWLISQGTQDVRVQTILFAWAFGALLEGLVGFGYPWAFVAPILIAIGIPDLDAIRVAAIANNAPVSYGALGAPIIALAAVTGYPLLALSGSISKIVAILALLPPWILLYLVSGKRGMWGAWPLAVVGSLGYIAGQLPVGTFLGPYLPDVVGAIVCFICILILLKLWRPGRCLAMAARRFQAAQRPLRTASPAARSCRRGFQSSCWSLWSWRGQVHGRRSLASLRRIFRFPPRLRSRKARPSRRYSTGHHSSAEVRSWFRGSSSRCCCA